jgi:hypothetical protein
LKEFCKEVATNQWGAKANCQQFARFVVRKLGLAWPAEVPVIGDGTWEPYMVDAAAYMISTTQLTAEKLS